MVQNLSTGFPTVISPPQHGAANAPPGSPPVHLGQSPPPAGFMDLTPELNAKGLLPTPDTHFAVLPGSNEALAIIPALFALTANQAPSQWITHGSTDDLAHLITLMSHGVVSEKQLVGTLSEGQAQTHGASPETLPHALAAFVRTTSGVSSTDLARRFELLRDAGFSLHDEDAQGLSAAHHAALAGNALGLEALGSVGVHLQAANRQGLTPLHCAAAQHQTDAIDVLIGDFKSRGTFSVHPITRARSWLPEEPDAINKPDQQGRTALHHALARPAGEMSRQSLVATLSTLIKSGAALLRKDHQGLRPMDQAATQGNKAHIQALGDLGLLDFGNERPRMIALALDANNRDTTEALFHGTSNDFRNRFIRAIAKEPHRLNMLGQLRGFDLNAANTQGQTPIEALLEKLSTATGHDFLEQVSAFKNLKKAGAHVSPQDEQRFTASLLEFQHRKLAEIKEMFQEFSPTVRNPKLLDANLRAAVESGNAHLVKSLIKSGANANTPDAQGRTALHLAAAQGLFEVVPTLLQAGAVSQLDQDGKMPANYISPRAQAANPHMVKLLHASVLGFSDIPATPEAREKFRALALQWHPDKAPQDANEHTRQLHTDMSRAILESFNALRADPG